MLESLANESGDEAPTAALDLAMVELAAGRTKSAEMRLRELRERFDALPRIDVADEAASMVSDDTAREFRPAGYEEVMVRAMLAVCSLARDGFDAESYAIQASERQAEWARRAEQRGLLDAADSFQPIALAPYLRGVLREATHQNYDDAARAYQLVSDVQPSFEAAREDLARAVGGVHSAPGHGVLYVFACVGRGPVREEAVAPATTASLQIASTLLSAHAAHRNDRGSQGPVLPNVASVKVPQLVVPPSSIAAVKVTAGGTPRGVTNTLTDVAELAERQWAAEMPWILARAVARRVTKEAAVASLRQSLGIEGTAGQLLQFAAASAWSGSEEADTRCWGLLPRELQVLRVELPVGVHKIEMSPITTGGTPIAASVSRDVRIDDGRNHYLVAIAPDRTIYVTGAE